MKILLVDQISSVTWKYSFSLGNALIEQGNEVFIATDLYTHQNNFKGKLIPLFNTDNKNIGKFTKLKNYISSYKKIVEFIKKNKIDILHLQWACFSPVDASYIKKLSKIVKIVFTIHDVVDFNNHSYDKKYMTKIYNIVDSIIIQTENNIELFKKEFASVDISKVHLAYHGHFLEYAAIKDKQECRKLLDIPQDKFVYMFFGQIKKIKGVDLLIKAFNEIQKEYNDTYLVIAGNVWKNSFDGYQKLIDDFNLQDKIKADIKFIPDENVDDYFSAADVMCLPYTELYQSGVVQLSYAYKKAAIVSNLPAFLTVVEDDKSGFVFESENYMSLVEKMKKAYINKDGLDNMAEAGYKFIEDKYSWEKLSNIINQIYLNALKF